MGGHVLSRVNAREGRRVSLRLDMDNQGEMKKNPLPIRRCNAGSFQRVVDRNGIADPMVGFDDPFPRLP